MSAAPRAFRSIFVAIALVAVATLSTAGSPVHAAATKPLKIVFPQAGAVINDGAVIQARFKSQFFQPLPKDRIAFKFIREGVTKSIRGPALDDAGPLSVLWDTSALVGGTYALQATFKHKGTTYTSPKVNVVVNQAPSALVTGAATGIQPKHPRGIAARQIVMDLNSNAKDPDSNITSIDWDFGDGTTGTGPTANHNYPPGHYQVKVTVKDDKGGTFVSLHELDVTDNGDTMEFVLHKTERCGCKSMRIKVEGEAEGDVAFDSRDPYGDLKELGPYRPAGTQLDMSAPNNEVTCRFEVIAELLPGSAPWKCAEGLRYQASDDDRDYGSTGPPDDLSPDPTFDTSKAPSPAQGYCFVGTLEWCDGGFHGGGTKAGIGERGIGPPNPQKADTPGNVYMLRQSVAFFETEYIKDPGGFISRRYHAKVTGPDGTCECMWSVDIQVDRNGMIVKNEVSNINCTNS